MGVDLVFADELLEAGLEDGAEASAAARVDERDERGLGRIFVRRGFEPRAGVGAVEREHPRGGVPGAHRGLHGGAEAARERGAGAEVLLLECGGSGAAEPAAAEGERLDEHAHERRRRRRWGRGRPRLVPVRGRRRRRGRGGGPDRGHGDGGGRAGVGPRPRSPRRPRVGVRGMRRGRRGSARRAAVEAGDRAGTGRSFCMGGGGTKEPASQFYFKSIFYYKFD
jgi:hypothetical protein